MSLVLFITAVIWLCLFFHVCFDEVAACVFCQKNMRGKRWLRRNDMNQGCWLGCLIFQQHNRFASRVTSFDLSGHLKSWSKEIKASAHHQSDSVLLWQLHCCRVTFLLRLYKSGLKYLQHCFSSSSFMSSFHGNSPTNGEKKKKKKERRCKPFVESSLAQCDVQWKDHLFLQGL